MPRKALETRNKNEDTFDTKDILDNLNKQLDKRVEDITENLKNKIDEQVEFQVSRRLKEEEKKFTRGQKIKIIRLNFIVLILLIIVCYFGYCLYDVDYFHLKEITPTTPSENISNKITEEPVNEEKPKEPTKEELIDEYGYLVENLIIEDDAVFDLFQDNLLNTNISNELKLKLAYKNIDSKYLKTEEDIISIEPTLLLDALKKILGSNTTIENKTFNYNSMRFMFYNNVYLGIKESPKQTNFLYNLTNASMENDIIKFEILIAKTTDNNELLNNKGDIITKEYNKENLEEFKSSLDTFAIHFKKELNNYILMEIQHEK